MARERKKVHKVQIIRLRWLSEMPMDLEILRILETGF